MVYHPREDSFLLESAVRRHARGRVLDMGTGTGIVARAALEKCPGVTAADIDPIALKEAKSMGGEIDFALSDLFENISGKFDTIVFNLPYLPNADPPDIALDGGKTGLELLARFLSDAKGYLSEGGQILFVQSSITGMEKTGELLGELGYEWETISKKCMFFEELAVFKAWMQRKE